MDYHLVKDEVRKNGVTSFMNDPYILILVNDYISVCVF